MIKRLLLVLAFAYSASAATLHVSAAASLTDALLDLQKAYEAKTGDRLVFNFGSSGSLARQIIEGAPVDVFLSADERQMDRAAGKGFIYSASRTSFVSNTLVSIVPSDSSLKLTGPKDFLTDDVVRIAVGDPETVPAGEYARQYLKRDGIWSRISLKLIPTENVRAALAAVEAGNVDCGVVYASDAQISRFVRVAFAFQDGSIKISYPAAVVSTSRNRDAGKRFIDYLLSPEGQAKFKTYGFLTK
jgi:molybdate transport system substrate-binding protein